MPNEEQRTPPSADRQMLRGSAWMIALRWAIRLTGLVSTIILARLLNPADFGVVAMAMVFVGMLEILNQTGQKLAIIRHPNPTRAHYDTAWTLSVIIGLCIGAAIVLLAPFTSIYFHEPRAVPVMQCLALRAALGGFENIGVVDFRRDIRFDRFFLYNMYPKIISFVVTIVLAWIWRNYWALVAGILTLQIATIIASYVMHPYRPRFSLAKIRELRSFSGWTLFRTIGTYFNTQIDLIAVGGVFGATIMGRYTVAADVAASPSEEINGPMVSVLYPVMASMQNDPVRLRQLYLRTLYWSAIICASASVGVTLVAHDMVGFVLGAKWLKAEPLVGWLALSAGMLGLSSGAYTTFDALGKPHLGARMQWVRLIFLALCIVPVALLAHHPRTIALTRMIVTAAFIPTLLFAVGREINVSPRDYFNSLWRPLLAAGVMALFVFPANLFLAPGNFRLAFDVFLGTVSFGGALLGLWWASGYPDSPEKDILASIRKIYRSPADRSAATFESMESPPSGDRLICLYVPISKAREYAPLPRSQLGRLKAAALRMRDRIAWKTFGSNSFDYYAWCINAYTNRGDIAIREAISQFLRNKLDGKFRYVELDWGGLDDAALAWINANADMFVICGGGYVSADAASGKLSRTINDVAIFPLMTCPIVAFGIGYNSLLEYAPEERVNSLPKPVLEKLTQLSNVSNLIGVRDEKLEQILEDSAKEKIALIGDPALFLEPVGILPTSTPALDGAVKVGLNFALHGPVSAAIFREHFDAYVEFLRRVCKAHAVEYFYFVHCDTEQIAISLLRRAGIEITVIDEPPAQLVCAYAQMHVVICQMLHSSILATNAGVPSMNIGYDQKNMSFYELMDLPNLCLPHDNLTQERLWDVFTNMIEHRDAVAQQLAKRKADLRGRTNLFVDEIAALLEHENAGTGS
jgi:lipopolysaccharide exporter